MQQEQAPEKAKRGRPRLPKEKRQGSAIHERVSDGAFANYAKLGGKLFLLEVIKQRMLDYVPGRRIKATITAEAWIDDNAVQVDAPGETVFDVTHVVLAMGRAQALLIEDNRESSDALVNAATAPAWIKSWEGPFRVVVADEIKDYFAVAGGAQ